MKFYPYLNWSLPVHSFLHVGITVMVTRTGLDSFPPQSVATTDTTCRPDSARDSGAVVEITPVWLTLRETI